MNVIFLSPTFPPQFFQFCTALKAQGITALGLGDTPEHELTPDLRNALAEYYYEPRLATDHDAALRAVAYLTWKHGRIDRIESHNEFWLGIEAQLREDFNIEGPKPKQLETWRSKSGRAKLYDDIGIPRPRGVRFESKEQVRAYAKQEGLPLVFKPDSGVGAASTFKVSTDTELEVALEEKLDGYIVQPFITGQIVSYDGLVDSQGRIVFETSHAYSSGIMEVVNGALDVSYWSRREIPEQLREYGKRTVKGFGITGRFFHAEFFELKDGSYRALEINVRPPGGFTTDIMNYTADIDVYGLWARMIAGQDVTDFTWTPKYLVAHASRRWGRPYRHTHEQIAERMGERLLWHRDMPRVLAGAMGDEMYLMRHPDFEVVQADIAFIQAQ